jgi:hypothetical protein
MRKARHPYPPIFRPQLARQLPSKQGEHRPQYGLRLPKPPTAVSENGAVFPSINAPSQHQQEGALAHQEIGKRQGNGRQDQCGIIEPLDCVRRTEGGGLHGYSAVPARIRSF